MLGYFDFGNYNTGLDIGRRLIATGNAQGSLPLLRELFAGAAESHRKALGKLVPQIQNWIVPILPADLGFAGTRSPHSDKLSNIVADLSSLGFDAEAVRVLVTAVGLDPAASGWLLSQAKTAFDKPMVQSGVNINGVANRLMDVGRNYLESGAADGITLMSAAHRVGDVQMPIDYVGKNLDFVPDSNASWAQISNTDAQAVTDYAYDLHRRGLLKTAIGVGTLITPMLGGPYVNDMMVNLATTAGAANTAVMDAARSMMTKGYAEQATDFLIASGAVSPESVWESLETTVIGPSAKVNAPAKLRTLVRTVSNAVRPAPKPPGNKALYFVLEGDEVRCNEVKWNADFDLVFNYDSPPPETLVEFYGKKFEALTNSNATIEVNIHPVGISRRDNIVAQEKTFVDGQMQGGPLRFKLKAPAKDSVPPSLVGINVAFSVNRNPVYKTFIPVRLVEQLSTDPCERSNLDLDVAEILDGASRPRDAEVFLYSNGGGWDVSWNIAGHRKELTQAKMLSMAELERAYSMDLLEAFKGVARKPAWNAVEEDFAILDDENRALARDGLRRTMAAGWKLYDIFCGDPVFKELVTKIDELPEGSRIAFHVQNKVFPWELMYPVYYDYRPSEEDPSLDPAEDEDSGRFWGARFHIESLLVGGEEKVPANGRQTGKLHISSGLSPTIDQEVRWRETPPGPVERQRSFFGTHFRDRWDNAENSAQIVNSLKQFNPASMIYFYCHGSSTELDFGDGKVGVQSVDPRVNYPHRPIIFINACDAGDISPLSFVSFRTKFSDKKAAGMIAPSFPIPTLFAAYFARAVLAEYDRREPIGKIIFELRRRLLNQDNPLGLWYSIQCPLDLRAPEE
jgi:Peptidase family C25